MKKVNMVYDLGFISDADILKHVKETVDIYKSSLSINLADF